MRKNLLIITNSFPTPEKPQWGIFVGQTLLHLKSNYNVDVIRPVPFFPKQSFFKRYSEWYLFSNIPDHWQWNQIRVYYPRYLVIPKFGQFLHPAEIVNACMRVLKKERALNKYDIINAHSAYPEGVAAVYLGKKLNIPVVVSALGSDINVEARHRLKRPQIIWALKNAQALTSVSRPLSNKMISMDAAAEETTVIYNGVDSNFFSPLSKTDARSRLELDDDEGIVLFVGMLREIKGLRFLLEAVKELKANNRLTFKLLLVGDGPLKSDIITYIEQFQLDEHVHLLGLKPHHEIPLYMAAADLFCLPSLNEGQPNVVLEALSCGVPVVASAVGGIPDLITNENGLLFPPGDANVIAETLYQAVRMSWRREAIADSVKDFTWEKTAEQFYRVYESLMGKGPG